MEDHRRGQVCRASRCRAGMDQMANSGLNQTAEQGDSGRGRHDEWEARDQVGDQERDDESQLGRCWQGWRVGKD